MGVAAVLRARVSSFWQHQSVLVVLGPVTPPLPLMVLVIVVWNHNAAGAFSLFNADIQSATTAVDAYRA